MTLVVHKANWTDAYLPPIFSPGFQLKWGLDTEVARFFLFVSPEFGGGRMMNDAPFAHDIGIIRYLHGK